jgi:hypothetical protein
MAYGSWEVYFFSIHLVFYICPTERRVLFNFLLAKGAGRSFEAQPSAESFCHLVAGFEQTVLEAMAI